MSRAYRLHLASSFVPRFLLVSCVFFLAGCPRYKPLIDLDTFKDADQVISGEVSSRLDESTNTLENLRGRFSMTLEKGLAKASVSQVLVYEKPSSVRLDIFATKLNRLVALLVATEGSFDALDLSRAVAYAGDDDGNALRHLLGIPLRSFQLARWFAGCAHVPRAAEMAFGVSEDAFLIAYTTGDNPPVLVMQKVAKTGGDEQCLPLLALEVVQHDAIIFSSELGEANADGLRNIRFRFPTEGISGEVRSESLEFNVDQLPSSRLFTVRVPLSFEKHSLSDVESYGVLFDY